MFESLFADVAGDALVGTIEDLRRQEAVIAARRLAVIAELVHRAVDEDDERGRWAFDPWDATAARVGAASNIGHRRASGQMHHAVALRDRFPRLAAMLCRGDIDARLVSQITWRTNLIDSDELIATIDRQLSSAAARFGPLSQARLQQAPTAPRCGPLPTDAPTRPDPAAGCFPNLEHRHRGPIPAYSATPTMHGSDDDDAPAETHPHRRQRRTHPDRTRIQPRASIPAVRIAASSR